MDDYVGHPNRLREALNDRKMASAIKKFEALRQVGQDNDTGERLFIDDADRMLFLEHRAIVQGEDGRLKAVANMLRCQRLLAPPLLGVVITGVYGAPPLPLFACFEEGITRIVNIDALQY